jgi:two-component system nitrate/nitrite sensor histidine kinase NarX
MMRLPSCRGLIAGQRLSTKIVGVLIGFLLLALVAIGSTLWLSWQLEGAAAAINETGSLRRHSFRLALLLAREHADPQPDSASKIRDQVAAIDAALRLVERGDPQRPLGLPPSQPIRDAFGAVVDRWNGQMRPLALEAHAARGAARQLGQRRLDAHVERFVGEIDRLVDLIEQDNALRTFWLRASQLALVAMAIGGTVALVYLMFGLIVDPVMRLRGGMRSMAESDFGVRLAVESRDEFGQLAAGFNEMADRLEHVYASLEDKVRDKTATLEDKNRELALLYDCAAYLQQRHTLETMCDGFLARISAYFAADGGTVRIVDADKANIHMVVHAGLSAEMVESERCMKFDSCLCGEAAARKVSVVHRLGELPGSDRLQCAREGIATVSIFQICTQDQQLGIFSLHFRQARGFSPRERGLLDTVATLLGVAIENMRLATREREMAISEERNLVARGLHDSIAQGLNFLNLQVQMLDDSLAAGKSADAAAIVPALRAGVKESYEDVRELLLNFRSRLEEDSLQAGLRKTVRKFSDQTGVRAEFHALGPGGPPMPREEQLQILFIAQEALSNIRKHAQADAVEVRIEDGGDFLLSISDNGVGFDASAGSAMDETHVGLHIMRERAQRIHAALDVRSRPGAGTTVVLRLAQEQRRAA